MKKICIYCGEEFESKQNNSYCSKRCATLNYYLKHKERYNFKKPEPEHKKLTKTEQKAISEKRKNRRTAIYKLMQETGLQYGEVSYFFDSNNVDGLYKRVEYLKSIGKIKSNDGERKMVKSISKGSPDYFMISTI